MSKSKGNIIDPIDLIDGISLDDLIKKRSQSVIQQHLKQQVITNTPKEFPNGITAHGTDALRFTFCALASTGRDINFDLGRIEGYRNFCNKLWNAARFVLMNTEGCQFDSAPINSNVIDRWIQSQFNETAQSVNQALDQYRFDLAAKALYEFTWNTYCDWYLELAKCHLNHPDTAPEQQASTQYHLLSTLEQLLRLLHPMMPFITEEIWQTIKEPLSIDTASIMIASYPTYSEAHTDNEAQADIEWLKALVSQIRNIRSEMNVSPAKRIDALCQHGTIDDQARIAQYRPLILSLGKLDTLDALANDATPPASATAVLDQLTLHLPLAGIIDKSEELKRLDKEIAKLIKDQQQSESKLNNPNYTQKAPPAVVDQERERLTNTQNKLATLNEHRERIQQL